MKNRRELPRLGWSSEALDALDARPWVAGLSFRSYGLRVGLRVDAPGLLEPIVALLPPGFRAVEAPRVERLYSVVAAAAASRRGPRPRHRVYADDALLCETGELDEALDVLEGDIRLFVASHAHRRIFVHAGAVAWKGRAILVPGRSYAGKSTLVAALVRAGATYYSDEYAVLDERGRVHPFARPLALREPGSVRARRCPVEALGGEAGRRALPVALVVATHYRPGARWRPRQLTPGQAVLELANHTVPIQLEPARALVALRQVALQALTLRGVRGEAEATARALLARAERANLPGG